MSRGMLVFVEETAESISAVRGETGHLVGISERFGQRLEWLRNAATDVVRTGRTSNLATRQRA